MPRDFIPRRDGEFLGFCANFSERISLSPNTFGLSIEQAAQYALAQQAFAAEYQIASAPGTSTVVAVGAKNHAREVLEAQTRMLARIVRAHPDVLATMLCDLGMCVPRKKRTRVPAPSVAPRLSVKNGGNESRTLIVRLSDAELSREAKPRDVYGAMLFAYVGDMPPAVMDHASGWRFVKNTTRAKCTLRVSAGLLPGTKVWLAARWMNSRDELGPFCQPVYAHIEYGGPTLGGSINAQPEIVAHHPLRFVDQSQSHSELQSAA